MGKGRDEIAQKRSSQIQTKASQSWHQMCCKLWKCCANPLNTFRFAETYLVLTVMYLIITLILSGLQRRLEKRLEAR